MERETVEDYRRWEDGFLNVVEGKSLVLQMRGDNVVLQRMRVKIL